MNSTSDEIAAIKQLVQAWHNGWQTSDIEVLLALFTEDAILMPQGQSVVRGRDAIRSLYEAFFSAYTVEGDCDLQDIEVCGELGYFWVTYTLTATPKGKGETIRDNSKSMFILRRQTDMSWKIARLMDNSNCERLTKKND